MNRKVTKQSTVTPTANSTKSSIGSGVSNIGKFKSGKEIKLDKMLKDVNKAPGVPSFTSGVINSSAKKKNEKPKAKMLPEVTVTAKKPMLQFARKAKKIK
jgi:hypothetical protein